MTCRLGLLGRTPVQDYSGTTIMEWGAWRLRFVRVRSNTHEAGSTRRRFLEMTGATVGIAGLSDSLGTVPDPEAVRGAAEPVQAVDPRWPHSRRVYHYLSHAYHIVGRFIDGFPVHDGHGLHKPPFEIASLFIEQTPAKTDLGRAKAEPARDSP